MSTRVFVLVVTLLTAVLAATVVAGYVVWTRGEQGTAALIGGPFELVDQDGRTATQETLKGKWSLIYFGYTYCPDVCPVTLAHLSRALREEEGAAERLQVLFVTVDPQRDTPEVLARYLEGFHPSILGLTGPTGDVDAQARGFGVAIRRGEGPGYLVDHGARTYLLDGDGRIAGTVPTGASYADVRDGVRAILERVR
jgi:protein SCO1/2